MPCLLFFTLGALACHRRCRARQRAAPRRRTRPTPVGPRRGWTRRRRGCEPAEFPPGGAPRGCVRGGFLPPPNSQPRVIRADPTDGGGGEGVPLIEPSGRDRSGRAQLPGRSYRSRGTRGVPASAPVRSRRRRLHPPVCDGGLRRCRRCARCRAAARCPSPASAFPPRSPPCGGAPHSSGTRLPRHVPVRRRAVLTSRCPPTDLVPGSASRGHPAPRLSRLTPRCAPARLLRVPSEPRPPVTPACRAGDWCPVRYCTLARPGSAPPTTPRLPVGHAGGSRGESPPPARRECGGCATGSRTCGGGVPRPAAWTSCQPDHRGRPLGGGGQTGRRCHGAPPAGATRRADGGWSRPRAVTPPLSRRSRRQASGRRGWPRLPSPLSATGRRVTRQRDLSDLWVGGGLGGWGRGVCTGVLSHRNPLVPMYRMFSFRTYTLPRRRRTWRQQSKNAAASVAAEAAATAAGATAAASPMMPLGAAPPRVAAGSSAAGGGGAAGTGRPRGGGGAGAPRRRRRRRPTRGGAGGGSGGGGGGGGHARHGRRPLSRPGPDVNRDQVDPAAGQGDNGTQGGSEAPRDQAAPSGSRAHKQTEGTGCRARATVVASYKVPGTSVRGRTARGCTGCRAEGGGDLSPSRRRVTQLGRRPIG